MFIPEGGWQEHHMAQAEEQGTSHIDQLVFATG